MKALVYHGPGQRSWDEVPDPVIVDPTDAVVRIDSSTICGTDLHILKGDVPEVKPGTILGHEAVGTVTAVGAAVTTLVEGDRVLVSCISSCGRCRFCKEARYGLCTGGGGWVFGHLIDGLQAEYARIPSPTRPCTRCRTSSPTSRCSSWPTSFRRHSSAASSTAASSRAMAVAIVGAGPIGLAAIMTAKLFTPGKIVAIDLADARLDKALEFGADAVINNGREDALSRIQELTDGLGADVAIEAVGVPDVRALHRADPAGRSRRQCRRARLRGDAPPGAPLDPGRPDHDGPRRHLHDAQVAEADRRGPARPDAVRDASLPTRRDRGGLRGLCGRGAHER